MRIVYDQPSSPESDDTEGHIERALIELGHEVVKDGDGDIYLFHKQFTPPKSFTGKKVCWYFDKVDFGHANREKYIRKVLEEADFLFLTDGTWAANNPNPKMHILRQGIGDPAPGTKEDKEVKIAFAGSPYGPRLKWAADLEVRYGKQFRVYRNQHNRQLNDLCASIPIFVAPKFPSDDYYWSNRVYLLVGSGAFLIHPRLKGLEEEWGDLLVYYDSDEDMYEKIQYYLDHPKEREEKRKRAYKHCVKHFTYKNRVEQLLKCVK